MKTCIKCEVSKEVSEFYKHSQMADGHLGKCKVCCKSDRKKNREAKRDYYLNYDRNRPNKQERAEKVALYRKTEKGKKTQAVCTKNYRASHPERYKAHNLVNNAVRDGLLIKPGSCETCNENKWLEAHHCDYNYPLDVMWLCTQCHKQWHRENKAVYATKQA